MPVRSRSPAPVRNTRSTALCGRRWTIFPILAALFGPLTGHDNHEQPGLIPLLGHVRDVRVSQDTGIRTPSARLDGHSTPATPARGGGGSERISVGRHLPVPECHGGRCDCRRDRLTPPIAGALVTSAESVCPPSGSMSCCGCRHDRPPPAHGRGRLSATAELTSDSSRWPAGADPPVSPPVESREHGAVPAAHDPAARTLPTRTAAREPLPRRVPLCREASRQDPQRSPGPASARSRRPRPHGTRLSNATSHGVHEAPIGARSGDTQRQSPWAPHLTLRYHGRSPRPLHHHPARSRKVLCTCAQPTSPSLKGFTASLLVNR
jgi:hypothetical protein